MKKRLIRCSLFVLMLALLFTGVSCKKAIVHDGYVDQNLTVEDLKIKGTVHFTINNETGTRTEVMAPKAVASAFEKAFPGTKVVVEEANRGTYPQRIAAGDIGDVFWCDSNDAVVYHTEHKALMPLDAYFKPMGLDFDDIYTGALDCGKIDGKQYLAPRKIGLQALIYSPEILAAAGISFDNSYAYDWDDFKDLCKALTMDTDEDGTFDQVGLALYAYWAPTYQMFLRGYGGEWVDNKNHVISLVSDVNVKKGLEELVNGILEGWIYPIGVNISGELATKFKGYASETTRMSNVAFNQFGAMTWLTRMGNIYDELEMEFDFCPMPAFPTHTVSCGATGYVVFNRTKNPDAAAAFALYFLTEDGQRAYHSNTGGNVPLLKSLADEDFWRGCGTEWTDKNYDVFVQYADKTKPSSAVNLMPYDVADILSDTEWVNALTKVLAGSGDIDTVFGKMETQANQKWEQLDS